MDKSNFTFALDIGTRSVVGLILQEKNGIYRIIDTVIKEHDTRSMLDGQIHDVLSVANVITSVKEELESTHGSLYKVCVAAAGRALKTERASMVIEIKGKPMIQKEDILQLELMAVQQAQKQLAEKSDANKLTLYDCVGYSVLHYQLDGEEIGSLIDQQGDFASVEIISTFLPKVVVESLLAALNRANLEMEALTLEPIAAINVLIPPSMRRLNIALVDIGAGTSDIAITDLGTIISYGMVPIAGDEITEAISDEFLLDFPLAEEAKRKLHTNDTITITDILGFEMEVPKQEVIDKISPTIDRLATSISEEIYRLNNSNSPKAVMLVGGGSLTPLLPKKLSEKLGLSENRVAIRGIDAIANLEIADHLQKGPELVTPIGIAVASKENPIQYISVKVNERSVRLFHMKALTVGDSLLSAGIQLNRLFGKPGMALMVEVNNVTVTIPGKIGNPPNIIKNEQQCSLEDEIKHGDIITVQKGSDGKEQQVQLQEILDEIPTKKISVNGQSYTIQPTLLINHQPALFNVILKDRDKISCTIPDTIEASFMSLRLDEQLSKVKPYFIELDQRIISLEMFSGRLYKNGLPTTGEKKVENGDMITLKPQVTPSLMEVANECTILVNQILSVTFNGKPITLEKNLVDFYRNQEKIKMDTAINSGDKLTTSKSAMSPFIFQDIFNVIDVDTPITGKSRFRLMKNGEEIGFEDQINAGDALSIEWL
ncbi:pilus assembly protein PilM [Metabacillus herbersteinensis]|uniref:Pilus assembly protein PilM n=1 Tax=Metabacillus herbersteinensis TaxID=283816 RepID=A0ABV6GA23_9BACI